MMITLYVRAYYKTLGSTSTSIGIVLVLIVEYDVRRVT